MAGQFPRQLRMNSPLHISLRLTRAVTVAVVIFSLPYALPIFRLGEVTAACILAIAVLGNNLLAGFGGQFSLGTAGFFGLGAYTTGILTVTYHVSAAPALLCGAAVAFAVGVVIGIPALRLQGTYLAIVTLAFGVLFPSLVMRFSGITGGSAGLLNLQWTAPAISYFAGPYGQQLWMYWVTIVALLLSCLVVWNLMRSRTGRAIVALRDNEKAAIVMGVNRTTVRTVLFGLSSAIAGLGGGLFGLNTGLLVPTSFSLLLAIYFIVGMVLGGSASYWGPIIGGFAIYFVPTWTSSLTGGPISGVIFGLIVIALVFVARDGLVGLLKQGAARIVVVTPQAPARTPQHVVWPDTGPGGDLVKQDRTTGSRKT